MTLLPHEREYWDARAHVVHHPVTCAPDPACIVHNPSDHELRHLPITRFGNVFYRLCTHDFFLRDPDAMNYYARQAIAYTDFAPVHYANCTDRRPPRDTPNTLHQVFA